MTAYVRSAPRHRRSFYGIAHMMRWGAVAPLLFSLPLLAQAAPPGSLPVSPGPRGTGAVPDPNSADLARAAHLPVPGTPAKTALGPQLGTPIQPIGIRKVDATNLPKPKGS